MSALQEAVIDYLVVRRALGYKLDRAEKLLGQFVGYCESLGLATVHAEVAIAWAKQPAAGTSWYWSKRLSVVRSFARWLQARDPGCELPPTEVFGPTHSRRAVPYLYTDAEIAALMDATSRLRLPLERATYRTVIGLLAVSGMRISEVINLDRDEFDADAAQLTVSRSKFGKSRMIALHPTSVTALATYAALRDSLCPNPKASSFFVSSTGTRLLYECIWSRFRILVRVAGLQPRSERCRPRLHDFRHRFAVLTLLDWHRRGEDVEARLAQLSTFMGHADPKHTYWYLSATPELFALAADRLERYEQERRA